MTNEYKTLKTHIAKGGEFSVMLHGWIDVGDGGQEHQDFDCDSCDGWSVYVRIKTPDDPQQPFDCLLDTDFDTYPAADAYARGMALALTGDDQNFEAY